MAFRLALIIMFSVGVLNFSQAEELRCLNAYNVELGLLDMGTYSQPAEFVRARKPQDFEYGNRAEFSRPSGRVGQVVGIADLLGTKRRIYMQSPSVVFGGSESKELTLNEKCEVESVDLTVNGTGIHISARLCHKIFEIRTSIQTANEFESRVSALNPDAFWSQSPFLMEAVVDQCDFYQKRWAK